MSTRHFLKILPEYFDAVYMGLKKCEVRYDDRGYCVGDVLILQEYDPIVSSFTGRSLPVKITHILRNPRFIKSNYVVLSIQLI